MLNLKLKSGFNADFNIEFTILTYLRVQTLKLVSNSRSVLAWEAEDGRKTLCL